MLQIAAQNTDAQIKDFYEDRKRLPVKCRNQYCNHVRRATIKEMMDNPECPKCNK